jgi:ligand-binding sensor domain-containing protein/histone H3/H4
MRKHFSPIFCLAFCLAVCLGLAVISRSAQAQSYLNAWRTFDQFDGAVGNWFFSSAQTGDAALWFGTDRGILRFDGDWQSIGQAEGLPLGAVKSLLVDRQGDLWATTASGVAQLHDEVWTLQGQDHGLTATAFDALAQTSAGDLLAAGSAGLFRRSGQSQTWQQVAASPVATISSLAVDTQDRIWLAGGSTLYRWDGKEWQPQSLTHNGQPITTTISIVAPSQDGDLWVSVDDVGIVHLSDAGAEWRHEVDELPSSKILALSEVDHNDLWVGGNSGGVAHWREGSWERFTIEDGLAANYVTSISRDQDGAYWFGTVAGVTRFDASSWRLWRRQDGAPTARIEAIVKDGMGRLWVSSFGDGVHIFADNRWQHPQDAGYPAFPNLPFIQTAFIDAGGGVWFGANNGGAIRVDPTSRRIDHLTSDDGLSGDSVFAIAQTPDGAMWFGVYGFGLDRWDGEDWQHFSPEDGLISDKVQDLLADSRGRLWLATEEGVSMLENGTWQNFTVADGLAGPDVNAISEGQDGSLWFAIWGAGAARLKDGVWTTFTPRDGLLAPGLDAVWADPSSARVWFGTVSGLSQFDGRTWQNFSVVNGLNIGRVKALHADGDQGLYLGVAEGLAQFSPDRTPPGISVTAVNGVVPGDQRAEAAPGDPIRIDWEGRDLLTSSEELFYLYRLLGYDADWQATRRLLVTYPPLPEGVYTFEVQARDGGLNYSAPASLQLIVKRRPLMIWLPVTGEVRAEIVFVIVSILGALAALGAYAIWSTLTRRAMTRQAVERRFNPYVAGSPIREETMFYGRAQVLREIESALHKNSVMIHGERRIGKTSLLYQLLQRLDGKVDGGYRFLPIFVDLEGTPESQFFHRLMEAALDAVHHQLPELPHNQDLFYSHLDSGEAYEDRYFRRDLRSLLDHLRQHFGQQPRLILLLDEADIMNTYNTLTQQQFRRILQDTFAQNVGVVVAGVNISKAWDRVESPWYNMFIEMQMPPFDRPEAERLMREPVAKFYRWDKDAIHYVFAQSQGRPHRIQQICLEAVNCMLDEKRQRIQMSDVQRAYERILQAEKT